MKLKRYCDIETPKGHCNAQLIMMCKQDFQNGTVIVYKCGHFIYKPHLNSVVDFAVKSLDGTMEAYPFQVEGVKFLLDNDANGFIGDQMALGKTIQALLTLRARDEAEDQTSEETKSIFPCLIAVRGSTIYQWQKQYKTWVSALPTGVWVIRNGKDWIPPGFKVYIISMDTLRSFVTNKKKSKKQHEVEGKAQGYTHTTITQGYNIHKDISSLGFKSVIADEVHSFKDPSSARTISFIEICKQLNIEHKIFLSGTPIKNSADEFYIPLNLLAPETFHSFDAFKHRWLLQDEKKRWTRINPYKYDQFKDTISSFFIRRERNEVLNDLPKFRRTFTDVFIEDGNIIDKYNEELEKLVKLSEEKENLTYFDVSDNLMALRRIVGVAKAGFADEYVAEFLEETDEEKITIGVHHHVVRDILKSKLVAFAPLVISGDDNAEEKYRKVEEFQKPFRRVMILSTLAGGTGIDGLQCCNNVLTVERQWSSADEEQFEDRFNRIGQIRPVTAEYFVAKGTIDEWLHALVERKRLIFGETISNNWDFKQDSNAIKELVHWATSNRLKK